MSSASPEKSLLFVTGTSVAQNLLRPLLVGLERGLAGSSLRVRAEFIDLYDERTFTTLWSELPGRLKADASCPGVVTAFLQPTDEAGKAVAAAGKAFVAVESPLPTKHVGRVVLDHEAGAADVAAALLDLGRRRFGYVGPTRESGWAGGVRLNRIREIFQRADRTIADEECMKYDIVEATRATARLIRRAPDLDAIIFASDVHAIGGMKALKEAGVAIPAEIAVVGFDDSAAARSVEPPLSSVSQPFEEAGEHAARLFLDMMKQPADTPDEVILRERLILRASCLRSGRNEIAYQQGATALSVES